MSILVIDDEAGLRRSLCAYLEDRDFDVLEAANGREGLEMLERHVQSIEAVIVDLNMPVLDGYSFIQEAVQRTRELPLIVLSGVGSVEDALRAVRLGAWDFITKPLHSFEILDHTLGKVLEKARLIRENRRSQELLDQTQAIGKIGGWSINLDTRERNWTRQTHCVLGYTGESVLDLYDIAALFAPEDRALFASVVRRADELGKPIDVELRLAQPGTPQRWVRFMGQRVDSGSARVLAGSVQDITDKKNLEMLRNDIDSIIRHDLKSPLNGIISFTQIMVDDKNLTPEQIESLHDITKSCWKILRQVDMSLSIMKIERGQYPCSRHPFNLLEVVRSIVGDIQGAVQSKALRIEILARGEPLTSATTFVVHAEERLCAQMLSNLIVNAVEASPEGERITISLSENAEFLVSIRNRGEVPVEIRDRFFEKYVTSGKRFGTGLGTYSASMFARAQGGRVELDATEEGATTVTVHLPLGDAKQAAA